MRLMPFPFVLLCVLCIRDTNLRTRTCTLIFKHAAYFRAGFLRCTHQEAFPLPLSRSTYIHTPVARLHTCTLARTHTQSLIAHQEAKESARNVTGAHLVVVAAAEVAAAAAEAAVAAAARAGAAASRKRSRGKGAKRSRRRRT